MKELGLIDGQIVDIAQQLIHLEDRGHQFGDGVYEVTKVYNGKAFALKPHLDRLYVSLRALKIPATYTPEELAEFHERLIAESGIREGYIYLQITRGTAARVHHFPEQVTPRLTMTIRPHAEDGGPLWQNGVKVVLLPDERWLRCNIKSLNLLGNVLAKQQAKEMGCYEAVLVRDGLVTEGASSNFFLVKDEVLWTHPATNLILKGITRSIIVERLAPELGIPVLEKAFTPEFIDTAAEAFITSTGAEIMPVTKIRGKKIGDGSVGAITQQLQAAYKRLIAEECHIR